MNRKRLGWGIALAVAAVSAGVIVQQRRARTAKHWDSWLAICNFIEAFKQASDVAVDLSRGTQEYIGGQAADIPPSLLRSLELASSQPVARALRRLVGQEESDAHGKSMLDTILQAAMTDRGQDLLALIVSVSTTRFMSALTAAYSKPSAGGSPTAMAQLLRWSTTPGGQALISCIVQEFVATGTTVYCKETIHINPYEQMLEAAAKPEHLVVLKSLTSAFCYAAVHAIATSCSDESSARGQQGTRKNGTTSPHLQLAPPQKNGTSSPTLQLAQAPAASSQKLRNGSTQHQDAPAQPKLPSLLLAACESRSVRQMCAGMAREGCAGAVQAGCEHLAGTALAEELASPEAQRVLILGVFLWVLLVPVLLLLYAIKIFLQ